MNQDAEQINYNAFGGDEESLDEIKYNDGVKLSGKKSIFSETNKVKKTVADFDQEVNNYKKNDLETKNKIMKLVTSYVSLIKDQKLEENKSNIDADNESDIINELKDMALQLDNDQSKPEGVGSVGLAGMLLKVNLLQRDKINELSYKLNKLELLFKKHLETKE